MTTTLADQLRALPDEALGALLQLRPDLVVPVPPDLSALAVRAQSRGSIARCLDGLDEFTLRILDAARLTRSPGGLTGLPAILALASAPPGGAPPAAVRDAVKRLRRRCLLYGPDDALHVIPAVDEVTSAYPAGLGRPADQLDARAEALCADPAKLRRTLLTAPPPARAVLDRLAAGPPIGALGGAQAPDPVRWLIEHSLLVPVAEAGRTPQPDGELVELPREVGLLLRRDSGPLGSLRPEPPACAVNRRDAKAVDSAGAGQAMEAMRRTEAMLEALAAEPAAVLKSGGLGVRELRRLAKAGGLDEAGAAVLLEVAYAAGLVGELDSAGTQVFLPTGGYDLWRAAGTARRWELFAGTWLTMTRQPDLIGQRDDRDRAINALAPDLERAGAPQARREVLAALAEAGAGAATDPQDVLAVLAWRAPRRAQGRQAAYRATLTEAALLGVTALGALTSYGRALLADSGEPAPDSAADRAPLGVRPAAARSAGASPTVRLLDSLLPAPVDHLLVQADLSVVVPGPPEPTLAAELDLIAEPESAGGASVYRVSPASVRRALDAGYTADDLHAVFRRRSRTTVPQALTYLIDDVARTHGGLRVGGAGAYLRSEDEALLAQVLADKRLAPLALRRLAPTVLCSPYQQGRLLDALREAGFAPVPEDASGAAVLRRRKQQRAPGRVAPPGLLVDPLTPARLTGPRLAGVVEQLRRGDAAARAARRAPVTVRAANGRAVDAPTAVQAHAEALAVLQQAVRDRALVWVGYVDAHGATTSRLVRPVSIGAGYLRAEDDRAATLHTFALHRITAAVLDQ